MADFKKFADLVEAKFNSLPANKLFIVDGENDLIWNTYLSSFPEGTNPIMSERTEHDCSCCKHFVRNIGNVVSIENGVMTSIWDIEGAEYPYDVVASKLNEFVLSLSIKDAFFVSDGKYGTRSTQRILNDVAITNNHFIGKPNSANICSDVATKKGRVRTASQVLQRSFDELTMDAVDDVIQLIDDKLLYKGDEFLSSVKSFKKLLQSYLNPSNGDKNLIAWENSLSPVAKFKNSVIGTLVSDLSSGVDLESAVKMFESKVAPHNYKRPKSLITKSMIDNAMKKINELGLRDSLERRFAKIDDVSVNNVLFADREAKRVMRDALTDSLMDEVKPAKVNTKQAIDISVDEFMRQVVPKTSSMEVLIKNSQKKNFVSLVAPVNEDAKDLFKWDNGFSWSYDGEIADSDIKSRVKSAGGNVTAPFRVSLGWFNFDDLDIHIKPPTDREINYQNKSSGGGRLDVDMNVSPDTRDAVENVCWQSPEDGVYKVMVKNFTKRESIDVGFQIEVENNGDVQTFSYPKMVSGKVHVMDIEIQSGSIVNINLQPHVTGGSFSTEHWGIKTEDFVKVKTLMNSPNYWDGQNKGNKHWFFLLDNCINPDRVRGFYNEFLRDDLHEHRKVLEIVSAKTKCEESAEQLSGVGFSSTKRESVTVRTHGDGSRLYNVKF